MHTRKSAYNASKSNGRVKDMEKLIKTLIQDEKGYVRWCVDSDDESQWLPVDNRQRNVLFGTGRRRVLIVRGDGTKVEGGEEDSWGIRGSRSCRWNSGRQAVLLDHLNCQYAAEIISRANLSCGYYVVITSKSPRVIY